MALTVSNEAVAQGSRSPGITHAYYGYGGGYVRGYGNWSRGYGSGSYGYTGYGNGPYGFESSNVYEYRSTGGYGDSNGTSYDLYYPNLRFDGGTYRRIYIPNNARFYSPYGNR
jgi:hypothetical protein